MIGPIVEITSGKLRGATTSAGIHVFKGIPYGGYTVGPGRFRPPQKPQPWAGVRDALEFGAICPQPTRAVLNMTPGIGTLFTGGAPQGPRPPMSEDCLFLHVWTPGPDAARRPVMFWCHGGALFVGSGSDRWYDGQALARRGDVVVVTANHRLGPLGYLHLGDLLGEAYADSGNVGMLDLVAALEWVRCNLPGAYELAARMCTAWASFARKGNPNHDGLPYWPAYNLDGRPTMVLADECRVVNDLDRELRLAWEGMRLATM